MCGPAQTKNFGTWLHAIGDVQHYLENNKSNRINHGDLHKISLACYAE